MNDFKSPTRRQVLSHAGATGLGVQIASQFTSNASAETFQHFVIQAIPTPGETAEPQVDGAVMRWMDQTQEDGQLSKANSPVMGVTWGAAWPQGEVPNTDHFTVSLDDGQLIPSQTWATAYWPDGSIKWTGHAISPVEKKSTHLVVKPNSTQNSPAPSQPIQLKQNARKVVVDTGVIRCTINKQGSHLIETVERAGRTNLRHGKLVCLNQNQPSEADLQADSTKPTEITTFESVIKTVTVEDQGPVRSVIKIDGQHTNADENTSSGNKREWLPFSIRLYFYAGSDHIRVMHTFIYDADEHQDFIRGLGIQFDVPMTDETYDRHTRLVSAEGGLWAEAVKGITGLRRDPGEQVRALQFEGKKLPPLDQWSERVTSRMHWIPTWSDVTLSQLSSDGFIIKKRTKPGHAWVSSNGGTRAAGVGYVGGASGGVAFGQRDFWQRFPAQIDIRDAAIDTAKVTMWMWAPEAKAMDLRFYHDGLGQDTHEKQLDALNITYEDYEPGFGTPNGIARTTEFNLWITSSTPAGQELINYAQHVMLPPLLACSPQQLLRSEVFGKIWSLPDRSTPAKKRIEDNLDFAFESYLNHQKQRRWYGFWDYGDVMHTYDPDRNVFRYDVGGYAWDNSELSPDLWLWYSYLRTGRSDIFRFSEAMCRHTGEVDVYHAGPFKGLGTRHNVQHWGCSAKQLRISSVAYRRFYYFLTADERTGDLLKEQVDGDKTFFILDPLRKIRKEPYEPDPRALAVGTGTDYSGLAFAWLTEWERTGDEAIKQKLVNSVKSIGAMPYGFYTSMARFDIETGAYVSWSETDYEMSHLSAVFGLVEVCAELVQLLDIKEFNDAWLFYCQWYNATREDRKAATGMDFRTGILTNGHSRLTAYAADMVKDENPELAKQLAQRAWDEFYADDAKWAPDRFAFTRTDLHGAESLNLITETPWMTTNDVSQWGLAAIQDLALVGDALPPNDPRTHWPAPAN